MISIITDDQRMYSTPKKCRITKNNTISREPLWSSDSTKGFHSVSDGLKHGDDDKQQRVDRNGNAQDAQELRAIENRIRVADEKADHFRREKPGDQAPDKGKAHRADGGKPDHFPHPLLPPGEQYDTMGSMPCVMP